MSPAKEKEADCCELCEQVVKDTESPFRVCEHLQLHEACVIKELADTSFRTVRCPQCNAVRRLQPYCDGNRIFTLCSHLCTLFLLIHCGYLLIYMAQVASEDRLAAVASTPPNLLYKLYFGALYSCMLTVMLCNMRYSYVGQVRQSSIAMNGFGCSVLLCVWILARFLFWEELRAVAGEVQLYIIPLYAVCQLLGLPHVLYWLLHPHLWLPRLWRSAELEGPSGEYSVYEEAQCGVCDQEGGWFRCTRCSQPVAHFMCLYRVVREGDELRCNYCNAGNKVHYHFPTRLWLTLLHGLACYAPFALGITLSRLVVKKDVASAAVLWKWPLRLISVLAAALLTLSALCFYTLPTLHRGRLRYMHVYVTGTAALALPFIFSIAIAFAVANQDCYGSQLDIADWVLLVGCVLLSVRPYCQTFKAAQEGCVSLCCTLRPASSV